MGRQTSRTGMDSNFLSTFFSLPRFSEVKAKLRIILLTVLNSFYLLLAILKSLTKFAHDDSITWFVDSNIPDLD